MDQEEESGGVTAAAVIADTVGSKRPRDGSSKKKRSFADVIAVCWDIEAVGTEVIGIGVAMMNVATGKVLEQKLMKGYFPNRPMDKRCWEEFWQHHTDVLELLTVDDEASEGALSFVQTQSRMVHELMAFVIQAEQYAISAGKQFHIVSDNKVFDIGIVNRMVERYYGADSQMPYSPLRLKDGTHKYMGYFYELQSMQRSLLCQHDPDFAIEKEWNYTERVRKVWGIPEPQGVTHDHNPVNDAISQLHEYRDMQLIFDGVYPRAE